MKRELKSSVKHTLPVFVGYVFLGFAFGILVRSKGCPVWYPVLMSLIIYSGALEFAAVPLLVQPVDIAGSFVLGVMLSIRHVFYGIAMLPRYKDMGRLRFPLIFGLTDETFSILSTVDPPDGASPAGFFASVTLLDYFYWNLGTFLGSVAGDLLPFELKGLDFALTALFISLFMDQLKDFNGKVSGFTGLLISAAVLLVFGSGSFVLISMLIITVLLLAGKGWVLKV